MRENEMTREELLAEVNELKIRLMECEETLTAIQNGEVDALVVSGSEGDQIYSLEGADKAYRTLIEEMDQGAAILTDEGSIFYCNSSLASMLKFPLEEMIGKSLNMFVSSNDSRIYEALLKKGLSSSSSSREIRLKAGDGTHFPAFISIKRIKLENHDIISMNITDLSEQKLNEEIIASERLSRCIFEQAGESIIVCDENGMIIRASNMSYNLCNCNPNLDHFNDIFKLYNENKDIFSIDFVLEGKSITNMEFILEINEGSKTFLIVNARPISSKNKIIGCVVTLTDITERKKLEEDLKKSHDHLEYKVEERTAEIEEAYEYLKENEIKLKDAITELERSNEELQSFAYITSHDLQEPLRNIASFAQLLQRRYEGKLDPDADEFINFMVMGATRMKSMIQGLLEYSRIGRGGTEFVKVNMNDMLEKAMNNLRLVINECNAEITHDPLPDVNADPNQMVSVFQNLISNAIKFKKPHFHPRIHISVSIDRYGNEWIFSVTDNGIGMETEYTDRIFEIFKRLHAIGEYEGTGIGLAIVKRIIENHSGRIWVESEYEVGTTFYFTLPAFGD